MKRFLTPTLVLAGCVLLGYGLDSWHVVGYTAAAQPLAWWGQLAGVLGVGGFLVVLGYLRAWFTGPKAAEVRALDGLAMIGPIRSSLTASGMNHEQQNQLLRPIVSELINAELGFAPPKGGQ